MKFLEGAVSVLKVLGLLLTVLIGLGVIFMLGLFQYDMATHVRWLAAIAQVAVFVGILVVVHRNIP
jgi:hypothetical protein